MATYSCRILSSEDKLKLFSIKKTWSNSLPFTLWIVETNIVSPLSPKKSFNLDSLIKSSKSDLYLLLGFIVSKSRIKPKQLSSLLLFWNTVCNSFFAWFHTSSSIRKISSTECNRERKKLISSSFNKQNPLLSWINFAGIPFLSRSPDTCKASSFVYVSTQTLPRSSADRISFTSGSIRFSLL